MSRLYVWVENEHLSERTMRAGTYISSRINYGDKDNSTLAGLLIVTWEKDWEKPKVRITVPKDIDLTITRG